MRRKENLVHTVPLTSLVPRQALCEEEREPGTHCLHMHQVPLLTCILLCYTKVIVNSVYLLKGHTVHLVAFPSSDNT